MTHTLTRRVLGGATALGASVALVGTGIAAAAPSSDMSTGSDGSSDSNSSTLSAASGSSEPLSFTFFDGCDLDATISYGGPTGQIPFGACTEAIIHGGEMRIGDFAVPIPDGSMKIAGGNKPILNDNDFPSGEDVFTPATGTDHGVIGRDLPVPGGALGTSSAENLGLTSVDASVEAIDTPEVNILGLDIVMPVRVQLSNPMLGDSCYLGSPDDPINLHLAPQTQEDFGEFGAIVDRYPDFPSGTTLISGATATDNDFAVPGATGCGPFGSLNWLVNARAHTPSPSGDNSLEVTFDAYNAGVQKVMEWRDSTDQP